MTITFAFGEALHQAKQLRSEGADPAAIAQALRVAEPLSREDSTRALINEALRQAPAADWLRAVDAAIAAGIQEAWQTLFCDDPTT